MDFFEAQERAKTRSHLLIFYFAAATALIVLLVYLAVTAGFFFYHNYTGSEATASLFSAPRFFTTLGIVIPLIGLGSLWRIMDLSSKGGPGIAESLGGRLIAASTKRPSERQLRNIVEEMSIASGVPIPQVYILDHESGINAFAAGYTLDDAAIAVTQGAIEQLDRDELQGVIAHEYSHILNGDMRLSTQLSGWIFGIMVLSSLGRGFWRIIGGSEGSSTRRSRRRRGIYVGGGSSSRGSRSSDNKGGGAGAIILAVIIVAILITVIGYVGEFFAKLIQAAVSRQREYLADAAAVQFTRNPEGIGNALRRIGGYSSSSLIENVNANQFSHTFFSSSLDGGASFFATHPALDDRISRILTSWNGDFLSPRPRKTRKKALTENKPQTQAKNILNPKQATQFDSLLNAGFFMSALGTLKASGQDYSQKTREYLQNSLPELFQDSENAPKVLLALLYEKESYTSHRQMEIISDYLGEEPSAVIAYTDQLKILNRSERLILLELITPQLQEAIPPHEIDTFIECIEDLIEADNKLTTFELACFHITRKRLGAVEYPVNHKPSMGEILRSANILASRLASETELGSSDSSELIQSASRQSPYFMNQLKATEAFEDKELHTAFEHLAHSPLGIQKQFLEVCERIIVADQKVTSNEAELFRAITIALGLPIAPIFADAAISD